MTIAFNCDLYLIMFSLSVSCYSEICHVWNLFLYPLMCICNIAFGAGASIPVGDNELQIGSRHNMLQLSWYCYCLTWVQLQVHEFNVVLAWCKCNPGLYWSPKGLVVQTYDSFFHLIHCVIGCEINIKRTWFSFFLTKSSHFMLFDGMVLHWNFTGLLVEKLQRTSK